VPESIIHKKSPADFWIGQTDEAELGVSYADADIILYHTKKGYSNEQIMDMGITKDLITKVKKRVEKTAHKSPPAVPELPETVFL
jgi:NAD+ synthase